METSNLRDLKDKIITLENKVNNLETIIKESQLHIKFLMVKCGEEDWNDTYVKCFYCGVVDCMADNREYFDKRRSNYDSYYCQYHRHCIAPNCVNHRISLEIDVCKDHNNKCWACNDNLSIYNKYYCNKCREKLFS